MAEPLQKLFSHIRRPRQQRRSQYQPFTGFGGDSPGMRGSINALDSQAITDSAQGVDISSIAPPTRLSSSRIDDELYQEPTPINAGQEGGGERSPFMFASGQGGQIQAQGVSSPQGMVKVCDGTKCYMVPAGSQPSMGQKSLPPGVYVNPGETFVEGSYREVTKPMAQGTAIASAAPASAAPSAATPGAGTPATQVSNRTPIDPQQSLARAESLYGEAIGYADNRQGVQAMIKRDQARGAQNAGLTAAVMQLRDKIAGQRVELANRGFALAERKHKAETGELRAELEAQVRANRSMTPRARAEQIVLDRIQAAAQAKIPVTYGDAQIKKDTETEFGVITAMDAGYFLKDQLAMSDAFQKLPAGDAARERLQASISYTQGEINGRLLDRYKLIADPADRAKVMRLELGEVYRNTVRSHLKRGDDEPDPAEVFSRTSVFVENAIEDVNDLISKGEQANPYSAWWDAVTAPFSSRSESAPVKAAPVSMQQEEEQPKPAPIQYMNSMKM